jgi:hypothetical protein
MRRRMLTLTTVVPSRGAGGARQMRDRGASRIPGRGAARVPMFGAPADRKSARCQRPDVDAHGGQRYRDDVAADTARTGKRRDSGSSSATVSHRQNPLRQSVVRHQRRLGHRVWQAVEPLAQSALDTAEGD